MSRVWRMLIAALLLGGTTILVPVIATHAANVSETDGADVLGPAPNDNCNSGNPRKAKRCHFNNQDNETNAVWSTDQNGATVQNGDLTIDLWRSADKPVVNTGFQISVTGNGAPISFVEWWADSPGGGGPGNDDLSVSGHVTQDCGGSQPCVGGWSVVTRNVGWYVIHARVVDTSGREAGTSWQFLSSENARS